MPARKTYLQHMRAERIGLPFKLHVDHNVALWEAVASANTVERQIGDIADGIKKPGQIGIEEIAKMVAFIRSIRDVQTIVEDMLRAEP